MLPSEGAVWAAGVIFSEAASFSEIPTMANRLAR
jgi:hypothetical protein